MTPTIEEGIAHHQNGRLANAEAIYLHLLWADPNNADGFHLLGVIRHQLGMHAIAVGLIGRAIVLSPRRAEFHNTLGLAFREMGRIAEAENAFHRSLELNPDYRVARDNLELTRGGKPPTEEAFFDCRHRQEAAADSRPAFVSSAGMLFETLKIQPSGQVLTGLSSNRVHILKVEIEHDPRKLNSPIEEAKIMDHLNRQGCVSCPQVHERGEIPLAEILPILDEYQSIMLQDIGAERLPFVIQDYVGSDTRPATADVILALLEQKTLGVYQGDLKPDNLRCDSATGLCILIDYDQAELLDDDTAALNNTDYLDWCNAKAKSRYGFDGFLHYFQDVSFESHVAPLFRDGSFNIGETALFNRQETTLAACGIYHSFNFGSLFADGERGVDDRKEMLDSIEFSKGERVLDVGCNAGLLSLYLHDRGCEVSGIDIDQSVIFGARIIANILRKKISYECLDIDHGAIPEGNNTVILFSVLHHTQNIADNARSIAERCNRIIMECRPIENGAKPVAGVWKSTSSWRFGSVDEMVAGLEALFPNFRLKKNHGRVDRARYILEFSKSP